ncbi:MAG: endonuclease/exonuclease/phosphatase family protein, partial [Candidatus Puniceispirillales bacterium]
MQPLHVDVVRLLRSDFLTISTWNVNSIKVRAEAVLEWLKQGQCDILLMQELKSIDENFPLEAFRDAGYEVHVHGQKTYNGVAIASKLPITLRRKGLPPLADGDDDSDPQARYIEVEYKQFII